MSDSGVFVQRQAGGAGYGFLLVLLVFPVMGIASFFGEEAAGIGTAIILGIVVLAGLVTFLVRDEYRVELGPSSMRFTSTETYFGIRRPTVVKFEIPLDAETRVKQVNTRTPSSRGGWNYGSSLHLPGDNVLPDTFLGSREIADSQYNRLTKALKERLGDRFTVEEKV